MLEADIDDIDDEADVSDAFEEAGALELTEEPAASTRLLFRGVLPEFVSEDELVEALGEGEEAEVGTAARRALES